MKLTLRLALASLASRRLSVLLAALAIALSTSLLLSVDALRKGARASFADTVSGVDVVVGARSGAVQLMLYSIFRLGDATNNFTWKSYQDIASRPEVAWIVPISLGDSHRGFRVLGTTPEYFERYHYRGDRSLSFTSGGPFGDLFDAVIGSEVAETLGYKLGDEIVVAHGLGDAGLSKHEDKPFRVAGVLARTGTPVDRTVHIGLRAIEAIHVDWKSGARIPGQSVSADAVREMDLQPNAVTAALVGLKSRLAVFQFQRFVNDYREEPLTAALPGLALQQLWGVIGVAETALRAVSIMVVAATLLGMATMLFATLSERRREMAILRSLGAGPGRIFGLLVAEAALTATAGAVVGVALHYGAFALGQRWLDDAVGLAIPLTLPGAAQLMALGGVIIAGALAGLLPAIRAYRLSLADGMTIRA